MASAVRTTSTGRRRMPSCSSSGAAFPSVSSPIGSVIVTVLVSRPDVLSDERRDAMLEQLALVEAEVGQGAGRRRREVRRPAPRSAASCCPASGSSCCSTADSAVPRADARWPRGARLPGRRQRRHRHRRGRGRRVHDHRQRPDGPRRRDQPVVTLKKTGRAMRDRAARTGCRCINLVESGGADLPTQAEIFIPGGADVPRPDPAVGAAASRRSRWSSATPPPAAPTSPACATTSSWSRSGRRSSSAGRRW